MHYFPVSPLFLFLLLAALIIIILLVELGLLTYAYHKMGIGRRYLFIILLLSFLGAWINIPIAEFPARDVVVDRYVDYFGVTYVIPEIEHEGKTILAINVGGCVIPVLLSLYLVVKQKLYLQGAIAVAIVAAITHLLARPVPGMGIAMPTLLPPAIAAIVAVLISRQSAAPLAYIAGSMGTLIGADLLNLGQIQALGAPVASIGGAGISDGIFLTGIIAVLLA